MIRIPLSLLLLGLIMPPAGADERPNFLLVLADDCTWSDLGTYGGQAATPHLDGLADQGMRFTHCFQAAPMCSPTRHNLYTGQYPVKTLAYPNHTQVRKGTRSVAHYLKDAGYRVALSGKTHIGPKASFPFEYSGGKNPDMAAADKLFGECAASGTPFLFTACSNEPHGPYDKGDPSAYPPGQLTLPPNWVDTPGTRDQYSRYLAEVTYFDDQVGQLLQLLRKHRLGRNTVVIVLSEQGSGFPFAKWTCYEAGVRSGCLVRWWGGTRPGSESGAHVEYVDMVPTMLDIAGVAAPEELDGPLFVPVLKGEATAHKTHTFSLQTSKGIINGPKSGYGIRAVRGPRYRYVRNLTPEVRFNNIIQRTPWWKEWEAAADTDPRDAELVQAYRLRPAEELYDCEADPWCLNNLIEEPDLQDTRKRLAAELDAWMKQQGDEGQATELAANAHLEQKETLTVDEASAL